MADIHILPCINRASGKLLGDRELSLVLGCPRGWDEGRGGRPKRKVMYVYTHSGCAPWCSRPTQYCKATMLLLRLYLGKKINPISSGNIPAISLLPPSPANRALAIDRHKGWGGSRPSYLLVIKLAVLQVPQF